DELALEVVPGAVADAGLCVDGARAQVRVPRLVARASGLGQALADLVRPRQPSEIAALRVRAGHEETHVRGRTLRGHRIGAHSDGGHRGRGDLPVDHCLSSPWSVGPRECIPRYPGRVMPLARLPG